MNDFDHCYWDLYRSFLLAKPSADQRQLANQALDDTITFFDVHKERERLDVFRESIPE